MQARLAGWLAREPLRVPLHTLPRQRLQAPPWGRDYKHVPLEAEFRSLSLQAHYYLSYLTCPKT